MKKSTVERLIGFAAMAMVVLLMAACVFIVWGCCLVGWLFGCAVGCALGATWMYAVMSALRACAKGQGM